MSSQRMSSKVSPPAFVVATSVGFHIGYVFWIRHRVVKSEAFRASLSGARILLAYTLVLFTGFGNEQEGQQAVSS